MGEMVASRSMQVLDYLKDKHESAHGLVEGEVKQLVATLEKIEKLLNNEKLVKENVRNIRNLVYTIEDALETWGVGVEEAFMPSKNEKKRGITRLLRRCFGRGDEGSGNIFYVMLMFVMTYVFEVGPLIDWFHATFPEDVLKSEIDTDRRAKKPIEWSLAHGGSLALPRQMYAHGMQEHFVEMKEDLDKLVELVSDQDEKHRVVSIWGAKGLGKTNLARRVYIDPKVRNHFNAFAWVHLSRDYQIDGLLQNILNQLDAGVAVKKSADEKKANPSQIEAVKKSSEEHNKKESAEHMIDVVTEDAEMIEEFIEDAEMIEGAREQKKGTEKRGNPLKSVMKTGAGAVKKSSAAEHKKGAEQKKEGAEEMIEDADELIEVVTEDAEETIEGAREQKKGTEKRGNPLKSVMKTGAGAVKKSSAAEHKKGAEQKKEGVEDMIEDADEMIEVVTEDAEETIEGAPEQKKGTEKRGNPLKSVMKKGAGAVKKSSAAEHKKGAEQKKEGAEEQPKSMMDQLKKILREEKCFIVIDGVTESSHWDYIKSEFLMEGAYTKFLLTTETEEMPGVGFSHKLRCLYEDEGWELLRKYAFPGKKVPDLGLMPRLGKEMVGKCKYLPSAISILGRTLSEKSSLSEWHKVNDDVERYLQKEAVQSESNELVHNAWDPTCYESLPYCEKQCFFYLAIFKKDEGVDPEDLSFLWMAESMFSPEERTILMDQAENYVREFASLLHVQVDELSTNRRFISLPDHVREYCLHMGVKEDFRLKVVDFSGGKQPRFDPYTLSDGTRRLVIHFNKLSSTEERRSLKPTYYLRSLLFLNSNREYVYLPVTISDFKEFTLLRILHFVRCKFEGRKLPEGIWKLLNLRYFGLLYCDLDKLPPSITNFRKLQVLNVRSYEDSKIVIPNVISQMVHLKHVRLPSNSDHEQSDRLKLDGLHDLETLDGLNAGIHDLDSLSKLEKLRDLSTHAYSNGSLESIIKFVKNHGARIRTNLLIQHQCDFTSREGMTVLEEVLMCPNLNALTFSMVVMSMFPNCAKYASEHLTQIKLIGCKLSADPMEALGKFPILGELWLAYGAFVGKMIAIGDDGGFPNLKYLEFRCLPNLERWRVHKGAMKKLSTLIVKKCPKLKGIPDGLASVSSLNNMEIELPPTALALGLEQIYKKKFAFVNSLCIRKLEIRSAH